jgi:hypothetical protein
VVYTKQIYAVVGINTVTGLPIEKWAAGLYNFYFTNSDGEKIVTRAAKQ